MLSPALAHLYRDLERIPAAERSRFESDVHRELLQLLKQVDPLIDWQYRPSTLWQQMGQATVKAVGGATGLTILTIGGARDFPRYVEADTRFRLKAAGCDKFDCPLNR